MNTIIDIADFVSLCVVVGFVVTFSDDDPKEGYARLYLTMKEMEVDKSIIGKAKPKNAEISVSFTEWQVTIH
jgi:hypothetical protein